MEHEAVNKVSVDELPPCRVCGQADCDGSHPAAAIVRQLVDALGFIKAEVPMGHYHGQFGECAAQGRCRPLGSSRVAGRTGGPMTSRAQASLQAARRQLEQKRDVLAEKVAELTRQMAQIDRALAALDEEPER